MAGRRNDIKAGAAYVEIWVKDNKFTRALKNAQRRLDAFGSGMIGIGAKVAGVGAAAVGSIAAAGIAFASAGDKIDKMSARTGIAADRLSALKFAAEQSGASIDDVGGAIQKMNRRLGRISVGEGTATQVAAMEELGLSLADIQSMNPEQRFMALADAIAGYGDQAAAAGLAQRAFGTGVDKLLPLFANGSAGIRELTAEAEKLGFVMSTEDTKAAAALGDAMNRVKSTLAGIYQQIGAAIAPAMTRLADLMAGAATKAVQFVKKYRDMIPAIAAAGVALITAGSIVMGLGAAFVALGSVIGGVATVVGVLSSPVGIAAVVIAAAGAATLAATAAFLKFTGAGQVVADEFKKAFGSATQKTIEDFGRAYQGIQDAIKAADFATAIDIAMAAANLALVRGVKGILETLATMNRSIAENLPFFLKPQAMVMNTQAGVFEDLASGLDEQIKEMEALRALQDALAADKARQHEADAAAAEARKKEQADLLKQAIAVNEERLKGATGKEAESIRGWISDLRDELARVGSSGAAENPAAAFADKLEQEMAAVQGKIDAASTDNPAAAMVDKLEKEIAAIQAKMKAEMDAANATPVAGADADEFGFGPKDARERSVGGKASIATFSAHGALAMAQSGGTSPLVRKTQEMKSAIEKGNKQTADKLDKLTMHVKNLGFRTA